ncbi:hypothetical protein J27TS7_12650 [Paenibacillus dendritiformis]|nr:hypothetical protein J27TS7_12650 [Paenibacillus dendritiformis]
MVASKSEDSEVSTRQDSGSGESSGQQGWALDRRAKVRISLASRGENRTVVENEQWQDDGSKRSRGKKAPEKAA